MNQALLVSMTIAFAVVSFILGACSNSDSFSNEDRKKIKKLTFLFVFLSSFSLVWAIGAGTRPWKVKTIDELKVYDIQTDVGSIQICVYLDDLGKIHIVNLNKKFQCVLPNGSKVKRVKYITGPYCGVSFVGTRETFEDVELIK